MFTRIASTGHYLPHKIVTNDDLTAQGVDTSDAWIRKRTGIERRRIAGESETTGFMAIEAGRQALERGGFAPGDIDSVIVATTTPTRTFPATAVEVQATLGLSTTGPAFDLQAVCAGFVYGMSVADALIRNGGAKRILLIGADKFTALLDWGDRGTCVLFGDGAGAVVLEGADTPGILATRLYADGRKADILTTDGGPGGTGTVGKVRMDGREVFREAVERMTAVAREVMTLANMPNPDWIIPHQANIRILEAVAERLPVPMARVVTTVAQHGNTSAASIPLALHSAVADGRIQRGQSLLLPAMGAGLTWGAVAVHF